MRTLSEVIKGLTDLKIVVEGMQATIEVLQNGKQRGPKTDRAMTDADAFRVKFGDMKEKNHKEAAALLGLSYGQVFSCRGGYTFKHVKASWTPKDGEKPANGDDSAGEGAK